ncbi:MAG: hypothetical protein FJX71_03675 [Alphaproteobacteria bacterium]|nr:hypothetical protein [Alphaproteobacteria bacterium]
MKFINSSFIKKFFTILFIGGLFNISPTPCTDAPEPSQRGELMVEIRSPSGSFKFYSGETIHIFDEKTIQRVEKSESFCKEYPNIKGIFVKIPWYFFNPLDMYEKQFLRETLTLFNLHWYDLNESKRNAHGFLCIPPGDGPFPCAILCHGSDGGAFMPGIMKALEREGIATLSMNRFLHHVYQHTDGTLRYVQSTAENQLVVPQEAEIIETLYTAKLISSHKKIDPDKIGFVGLSRGGNDVLECIMKRNIDLFYPGFNPAFCVCYYTMPLIHRQDTPLSPILFLHGAEDDYTPLSSLFSYINYLLGTRYVLPKISEKKVSLELDAIKLIVYTNAGHAFDAELSNFDLSLKNIRTPLNFIKDLCQLALYKWHCRFGGSFKERLPNVMNLRDCHVRALPNDRGFIDANNTRHPWKDFPSHIQKNVKYGVTLQTNPEAGIDALQETLRFIKKHISRTTQPSAVDISAKFERDQVSRRYIKRVITSSAFSAFGPSLNYLRSLRASLHPIRYNLIETSPHHFP